MQKRIQKVKVTATWHKENKITLTIKTNQQWTWFYLYMYTLSEVMLFSRLSSFFFTYYVIEIIHFVSIHATIVDQLDTTVSITY